MWLFSYIALFCGAGEGVADRADPGRRPAAQGDQPQPTCPVDCIKPAAASLDLPGVMDVEEGSPASRIHGFGE